jgi:hypothetical protein
MYSIRMVFTVTAMVFRSYLVIYMLLFLYVPISFHVVFFRGSRLTAVSCMRAGENGGDMFFSYYTALYSRRNNSSG